jgi:hypothetical protein
MSGLLINYEVVKVFTAVLMIYILLDMTMVNGFEETSLPLSLHGLKVVREVFIIPKKSVRILFFEVTQSAEQSLICSEM